MRKKVIYIHGQGGNAGEAEHYKSLFSECEVIGFNYSSAFPWEAVDEFPEFIRSVCKDPEETILIANSIGAYFSMIALPDMKFGKSFFISPVVDMEKLILDMMRRANVTENELREKGEIDIGNGQILSWKYLTFAREYPIKWSNPTYILYGENDALTPRETVSDFSEKIGAKLTVMKGGEHWFHTDGQMEFLDKWISSAMM